MTIVQAIIQGVVQGLTVFLPISSNGVLSIFQNFGVELTPSYIFLVAMLRLGTVASILAVFYNEIIKLIKEIGFTFKDIFKGQFTAKTNDPYRKLLYMLFLASLPLILFIFIRNWAQHFITDNDLIVEGILFIISSVFIFFACSVQKGRSGIQKMRPRSALTIGVSQLFGIFPGVSRSGMSTSMGLMLGFSPSFAVSFSFLLAIPALVGNSIFQIGDAVKENIEINFFVLFIGMLVAAVVGFFTIRIVQALAKSGKYKLIVSLAAVLGVVVLIMGIAGAVSSSKKDVNTVNSTSISQSDAESSLTSAQENEQSAETQSEQPEESSAEVTTDITE